VDHLDEITLELELLSRKNPENITEADATKIDELASEAQDLISQIFGLPLTIDPGSGLPAQPAISIMLSSNPSGRDGQVDKISEVVRAIKPAAAGNLGVLNNTSGVTPFSAVFTPNGNYGALTLQGTVGEDKSNVLIIRVTGQTKEQAEAALAAHLAHIDLIFEFFLAALTALALVAAALIVALIAAAAIWLGGPLGVVLIILGAIGTLSALMWAAQQRLVVIQYKENVKKELKDAAQPLIDELPSSGE